MTSNVIELNADTIIRLIEQLPEPEQYRVIGVIQQWMMNQPKNSNGNHASAPIKTPTARELSSRKQFDKRVPTLRPMPDRTREDQWVEDHKHEYPGYWVALDGDRLVAASFNELEVWDAVDADEAELPIVLRVPSPDDFPEI